MTLSSLSFVFRSHRTKAGKSFPGSMGPKIEAAIKFVEESENPNAWAAIGDMKDAAKIMSNEEGTIVRKASVPTGVVWRERVEKERAVLWIIISQ